jgi:hypothetical protein
MLYLQYIHLFDLLFHLEGSYTVRVRMRSYSCLVLILLLLASISLCPCRLYTASWCLLLYISAPNYIYI